MAAGLQVLPSGQRGKWIGITVLHNKLRHFLTDFGRTHIGMSARGYLGDTLGVLSERLTPEGAKNGESGLPR
jgi:hypothetical protein